MPKRWKPVRLGSASGGSDERQEWAIEVAEVEKGFSHKLPSRFPDKASAKAEIREWKNAEEED